MPSLTELGQEYAGIILRQETGMNILGEPVERYEANDTERLGVIEDIFYPTDRSLGDYVDTAFDAQEDSLECNARFVLGQK